MLMKQRVLMLCLLIVLSVGFSAFLPTLAQEAPTCNLDTLLEHQQEHAARIANLEHMLHDDPDTALEVLYITGIAYQALAADCGFERMADAAAAHAAEHETEAGHELEDEHDRETALEAARAIGDPENGKVLFNSLRPEVGFACATCHRVDTTERLVGPGLLGIGSLDHDPSAHEMGAAEPAGSDGHTGHGTELAAATAAPEGSGHTAHPDNEASADAVEYIRTSIVDPGAFLVPGFPDHLMPRTYGEIYTESEINDLIAYLITLQ